MNRIATTWMWTARLTLSVIAASFAFASLAEATPAPRTFVASTGVDGNAATNCQAANPCRSFSAAYGVTASGGEIIALDTAGFGTLTISMPISIIGTPQGAEVTVGAGQTGITISAGASNIVHLRNLNINGGSSGGNTGINVTGGRLILENSVVKFLNVGISLTNVKADIVNTDIIGNTTGIVTSGEGADPLGIAGIAYSYASAVTEARIYGGHVLANTTAYNMMSPGVSTGGGSTSDITILISQESNVLTNTVGNGTLITGSGTGCPSGSTGAECTATGVYSSASNNGSASANP